TLSLPSPVDTTIPFTIAGTAVSGTDFSGVTASPLVIPAGQTSAVISGTLLDNPTLDMSSKTLIFTLTTPTNAILGVTKSNTLTLRAKPQITWPTPKDITYHTPLSATQLAAAANVPGTFAYLPPSGTILGVGASQTLAATFTPSDTANYDSATFSTTINVTP